MLQSTNSFLIRLREVCSFKSVIFQMNDCSLKVCSSKKLLLPSQHAFSFSNGLLIKWLYCFSVEILTHFNWPVFFFCQKCCQTQSQKLLFLLEEREKRASTDICYLSESKVLLDIFKIIFKEDLCISLFSALLWFNPWWQLSTWQPLAHCSTGGMGERTARVKVRKLMGWHKDN